MEERTEHDLETRICRNGFFSWGDIEESYGKKDGDCVHTGFTGFYLEGLPIGPAIQFLRLMLGTPVVSLFLSAVESRVLCFFGDLSLLVQWSAPQ